MELVQQTTEALGGKPITLEKFPHQMAFNVAFDWPFLDSGDTEEEVKMINETPEDTRRRHDWCLRYNRPSPCLLRTF